MCFRRRGPSRDPDRGRVEFPGSIADKRQGMDETGRRTRCRRFVRESTGQKWNTGSWHDCAALPAVLGLSRNGSAADRGRGGNGLVRVAAFATEDHTMPERPREPVPDDNARPESPDSSGSLGGPEAPRGCGCTVPHGRPNPLWKALARVIRRIDKHWFGVAAHGWSPAQRCLCASAGSSTFFLALFFSQLPSETIKYLTDVSYIYTNVLIYIFLIMFSVWFAWLVSWKDMKYGPTRLYLSGFLLPYFVWFLVARLFVVGQ